MLPKEVADRLSPSPVARLRPLAIAMALQSDVTSVLGARLRLQADPEVHPPGAVVRIRFFRSLAIADLARFIHRCSRLHPRRKMRDTLQALARARVPTRRRG